MRSDCQASFFHFGYSNYFPTAVNYIHDLYVFTYMYTYNAQANFSFGT